MGARGVSADLAFFHQVQAVSSRPVILTGGITPETCLEMVHSAACEAGAAMQEWNLQSRMENLRRLDTGLEFEGVNLLLNVK